MVVLFGGLSPLLLLVQQLQDATSATFDDPEQFIDEIVAEVLELPPAQRFKDGVKIIEADAIDEFGSLDSAQATFPIASAILFTFLEQLFEQWSEELGTKALGTNRNERNSLLVVLGAVSVMEGSMNLIQAGVQSDPEAPEAVTLTESEKYQLGSVFFGVYARLYREIKREQEGERPSFDTLAEDVLYADRALTEIVDPDAAYPAIEDLSDEEIAWSAIRLGALRMYVNQDISVGRGAELAGMTQEQFVQFLTASGIESNYGPDSVEELHSGPDL